MTRRARGKLDANSGRGKSASQRPQKQAYSVGFGGDGFRKSATGPTVRLQSAYTWAKTTRISKMPVSALGYVGVRSKDLSDWASYGAGCLGLQRIDKARASMAFRMDDRSQRIFVNADGGEGIDVFGWEADDAAA